MKKLVLLLIGIIFIQLFINGEVNADNSKLVNKIIEETAALPVEYGSTSIFQYSGKGSDLAANIKEKTGCICICESNSKGEFYTISSKEKGIDLQIKLAENQGEVNVKTLSVDNYNKVKSILQNTLSCADVKADLYEYTKYKINDNNLSNIYSKVNLILKSSRTSNLNETAISNGYSITGYTGFGRSIRSKGSPIDINIAILSYESGSYLIIGTPEIMTTY
ncbi:MAG: YwmB family TATA-box binding protein [Solirubrobacterales bacterium]